MLTAARRAVLSYLIFSETNFLIAGFLVLVSCGGRRLQTCLWQLTDAVRKPLYTQHPVFPAPLLGSARRFNDLF